MADVQDFTPDNLNRLKKAMATGALTVEYADKKVTYRSLNEMVRLKTMMEKEILGDTGDCDNGVSFMEFDKGL